MSAIDSTMFVAQRSYFNKEDEKLLRQLLKKAKNQADSQDTTQANEHLKKERESLMEILGKYNPSEEDIQGDLFVGPAFS